MRNFAIGLLVLNLLYLSWNLGLLPGSGKQEESFVRSPRQQAPASLVLLKELTDQQLRENTLTVSETTDTGSLSETASAQITEISTQDSNADGFAGEGIVAGAVNSCLAFGVFDNIASSNALVTQLRQQGFQARVELQEQTDSEYRSVFPAELGLQTAGRARGRGISNQYPGNCAQQYRILGGGSVLDSRIPGSPVAGLAD